MPPITATAQPPKPSGNAHRHNTTIRCTALMVGPPAPKTGRIVRASGAGARLAAGAAAHETEAAGPKPKSAAPPTACAAATGLASLAAAPGVGQMARQAPARDQHQV